MKVQRVRVLDEYVDHRDGRSAVMLEKQVLVLSPIATEILRRCTPGPLDLRELATHLVEAFGEPTDSSALALTEQAVADMVGQNLLVATVA